MSDRPTIPSTTMTTGAGWCGQHGAYFVYSGQPGGCPRCRAIPRGHCPTHGRIPGGYACPACELRDTSTLAERRLDALYERQTFLFSLVLDLYAQLEQRDSTIQALRARLGRLEGIFTSNA